MKPIHRLCLLAIALLVFSCGRTDQTASTISAEDAMLYVASHTSGLISTAGEIRLTLSSDPENIPQRGSRFVIEPSVRGQESWLDDRTIVFKPLEPLKPGTVYKIGFRLNDLFPSIKDEALFSFDVSTIQQDLEVRLEEFTLDAEGDYAIRGVVMTADVASRNDVMKTIRAEVDGRIAQISWPESADRHSFEFHITGISRSATEGMLKVRWDGNPIGVKTSGAREVAIPAAGQFSLIETRVNHDQNPHIELVFSDYLDAWQNLRGLVRLGDNHNPNTLVHANRLIVYFTESDEEEVELYVSGALQSRAGIRMEQAVSRQVRVRRVLPEVRLVGRGVILPASERMLIPFEAIGLGAVDVRVVRIFEQNIPQFLQVNELSGDNELRRVGKTVLTRTIALSSLGTFDPNKWSQFALDLAPLMKAEAGAVYHVTLAFRPHHRAISCPGEPLPGNFAGLGAGHWLQSPEAEENWWRNFDNFWWHSGYTWRERDNPCSDSYYTRNRWVSRNLLASDLGIIVKGPEADMLNVFVTNLNTTASMPDVKLSFYNHQRMLIKEARTGRNGQAEVSLPEPASLLIASDGKSKGYVRLQGGRALSLSTFDVSGSAMQEGLKGFIYGERGVWRPGDSLFVTLIIEDAQRRLPANHPVQFELRNPEGQVTDRRVVASGKNGFYTWATKTAPTDPTGMWNVSAQVGGARFSRNLRIETIRPNRLDINLDIENKVLISGNRELKGTLRSKWLHGAPASNLKADIALTLAPSPVRFTEHGGYVFDDFTRQWTPDTQTIFEGQLDETGESPFSYTIPDLTDPPGRFTGQLFTRVFERSGNFSINRDHFDYYPYRYYTGIQMPTVNALTGALDRDKEHQLRIITLDADGKPVSRNRIEVTVYELGWRWWWQQPGDGTGVYFSTNNLNVIHKTQVWTQGDGTAMAAFNPGDRFGRIIVRVEDLDSGHSASALAYVGYSWRDDGTGEGPARLAIRSDKGSYQSGEDARITFPSSAGQRALVSLETGSRILRTFWVDTQPGETSVTIETSGGMSPNFYAHVMLLQPHAQMGNDLPPRMYGVVPVMVQDPGTVLEPVLTVPDETRPNKTMTVKISENNGKPMTYTLAIVDEGLLSLTNFRTPDPHRHFYAREALGIKTWDMFDLVAGPFMGNMGRILAVGGDRDDSGPSSEPEITRFRPVVSFLGPFHLESGKEAAHEVMIPNYIGSVRVMAVAGFNGAYGNAAKNVPVRQPLMALATLPRVLGPGETVELPVTLFTGINTSGNVSVNVAATDRLAVSGPSTQTVAMNANAQQLAMFRLNVARETGSAGVTANASLGNERASDSIEIEIRNPNPPSTRVYQEMIEPGDVWEFVPALPGIEGTNSLTLEVSAIAPIDLERRLGYLIGYPHGCLEQIVSSAFPQLYLSVFHELSATDAQKAQQNINEAIRRIRSFQMGDGSLSYWPGESIVNEWTNVYAFHFLIDASRKGYNVSNQLLSALQRNIRGKALNWRSTGARNDALLQAYRLYALVLNGTPEAGAMNRMREQADLPSQALWRLAAAYRLAGQPDAAVALASAADFAVQPYREWGFTFGTQLRDQAMILESLALMGLHTQAAQLALDISAQLSSRDWLSTQETAFSLIAMARYLEGLTVSRNLQASFVYAGAPGTVSSMLPVSTIGLEPVKDGQFRLENKGEGVMYARVVASGTPLEGDPLPASNQLRMSVRYLNIGGEVVDPSRLVQGTDIVIETVVSNPGRNVRYTELALTQILPSGWEIHNTRMDDLEFTEAASSPEYQDIRDDRVLTYFNLNPGESKTFRVLVNASYAGRFYMPSFRAYAMYDESIFARSGGKWVEVVREGN